MYSEAEELSNSPDNPEEVNFIDKVLGEMKNKFNKPEKGDDPPNIDAVSCSDDAIGTGDKTASIFEATTDENNINAEKCSPEVTESNEQSTSPETKDEDPDNKPRIVMFLPKPTAKLKATSNKRALRSKPIEKSDVTHRLKRSSLRRGRDGNESVLQSAIARKEKSYNESSKPQRLVRKLKPTQKALDNIVKPKSNTRSKLENEIVDDRKLDGKSNVKKRSKNEISKSPKKLKNSDGNNTSNIEERCRRSQRISSVHIKDEILINKCSDELDINDTKERIITNKIRPNTSKTATHQLCLCTKVTNIYTSEEVPRFCTAIDSFDSKFLGCNRAIESNDVCIVRPSTRVPYLDVCDVHLNRLFRHHCCPTCGTFCTQGTFLRCEHMHLYHVDCQAKIDDKLCCPHCGKDTPKIKLKIRLVSNTRHQILPSPKSQLRKL